MTTKFWGRSVDSVVMLTWSDWKTEPRSNRYHFAVRFARHVPVFFVQPDSTSSQIWTETVAPNITLVHAPTVYDAEAAKELSVALHAAGCRKPMLWIYNVHFEKYISRSNAVIRVMHATEDYFTNAKGWRMADSLRECLTRVLENIDLLVAVSAGVLNSYVGEGKYKGATLLLENGCDSKFWYETRAFEYAPAADGRPIALFQGGINKRLDFPLLIALARRLPNWSFWFCGNDASKPNGWRKLISLPNVRYFGIQTVEGVATLAKQAAVGLIPFQQDELMRLSLPLKAYEYVACGMPVVSIPIDAIAHRPDLFRFATDVKEFAEALEGLASTRSDPVAIERRLAASAAECYDSRFDLLVETMKRYVERIENRKTLGHRYNILLLYDDLRSMHVRTITEHIEAFQRYSGHNIVLVPATGNIPGVDDGGTTLDFSAFDALVIHYSVRLSVEEHLSKGMAKAIAAYDGPKLLYIQDEYENTEIARGWIERLGIDTVFTCVPLDQAPKVYLRERFPKVDFVETLTGYVPEDVSIDEYAMPLADRFTFIGYRGRRLPHHYGLLGQEKYRIGVEVRDRAIKLGLPIDIEVDDSHRIYGKDWYRFLGSCRATLGTESGANVFDDDGELKRLSTLHSSMAFDAFARKYLEPHEGRVLMNQVSPRIFEAIRLRTALILFEGNYSGIVKPDVHYIPLNKDFSNFEEVVEKISSLDYLNSLTERAYRDIIESGRWSYRAFAEDFSRYLSRRLLGRPPRARIFSAPMLAFRDSTSSAELWRHGLMNGLASGQILHRGVGRDEILSAISASEKSEAVVVARVIMYERLKRAALITLRRLLLWIPGLRSVARALRRLLTTPS